jgi:catechol 2,3-dioxygenase-like lactoylglutathione lyase family enzyme
MIYELNHVGIVVSDLERTVPFYTKLFGAREVWRASIESIGLDIVYLQIGGNMFEFLAFQDRSHESGPDHFGFLTDDLDGDYARLVAAGYESVLEPRISGSGVGRQAFVLDSDGTRIELLQRELPVRFEPADHPIVASVDHIALLVDDLDKALAFYVEAIGMNVLRKVAIPGTDVSVTYLDIGTDVLELLPRPTTGQRIEHIALRVPDAGAALAFFVSEGAKPDGPSRPAASGIGRIGSITDPDGVVIEVLDRPDVRNLAS